MQYPLTDEQIKEQEILKQQLSQFKNPKPLTDDLTSQLVRESGLTSGLYRPSDVFRNANSIDLHSVEIDWVLRLCDVDLGAVLSTHSRN